MVVVTQTSSALQAALDMARPEAGDQGAAKVRQYATSTREEACVAIGVQGAAVFCRRDPGHCCGVHASPHTPLPQACLLRPSALPAAQALILALPDELLGTILRRAWADRPPRAAADEVRCAVCLATVCRRWRELLRTPPLPLALDFSAARLSGAQRRWLLAPAQAGRVRAVSFDAKDALWKQRGLKNILALHGSTLLQLSGVPLALVASVSQEEQPNLDLSGLRLSKLGISCCGINELLDVNPEWPYNEGQERLWLWPARLPGALEDLELLGLDNDWLGALAWAPGVGSGSAGRLPRLQTLRVTAGEYSGLRPDSAPLLRGFPGLPAIELDSSGRLVSVAGNLFEQVGSARIVADGCVHLWADQEDAATFVDRLCSAGLQAAELCAEHIGVMRRSPEEDIVREVVRELLSRYGEQFAVEVDVAEMRIEDAEHEGQVIPVLERLAWRRWPAPGAPGLPAARAAHARARAWAAEAEPCYWMCVG